MSTKERIHEEVEAADETLSDASEAVRERAERAAEETRRAAYAYAEEGKRVAADNIDDFAAAARAARDTLAERRQDAAAGLVTEAVEGLDRTAGSLRDRSLDELVDDVGRFARRSPAIFVLGAVAAGLAIGRFATASSERARAVRPPNGSETGPAASSESDTGRPRPKVGPSNPTIR